MASFLDVCRFTPTLGGATDWTVSTLVMGYQTPASAGVVSGAIYRYRAESADLTQWEVGYGAYSAGILARTVVLYNSLATGVGAGQSGAGNKITFSTIPQVAIVALAEDLAPTNIPVPSGRLSFSSSSAITTTDLATTSAATLWYVDTGGGVIPIWDSVLNDWRRVPFSGALSLALDSNAGHTLFHSASNVFDVYAFYDATLGVRFGTAGGWGAFTTGRGSTCTDITQIAGIWVNSVTQFIRINNTGNVAGTDYISVPANQATYLGTMGTVAAGQGEDSVTRRLLFSAYNTRPRHAFKKFTGSAYLYASATYRQVNADATMQVEVLFGLNGVLVDTEAVHFAACTVAPAVVNTAIGIASTTTPIASTEIFGSYARIVDTSGGWAAYFRWKGYPGLGRTIFTWLESGTVAGTGANFQPNSDLFRNGISVKADI